MIPIIGTLIVIRLLDNDLLCHVCMVMLGTPVASMVVMLAQTYDADSELMSRGVALTTILSVITIPMVFRLLYFRLLEFKLEIVSQYKEPFIDSIYKRFFILKLLIGNSNKCEL